MQDTFGRKITYLRLSVTDLCNLRCRYCMGAEGVEKRAHSEMCSLEQLRDIAAAAAACGVRKIRLTGGEPLVRRGIVELCRMLREIPGIEELCLTTNGVLLPALAAPLRAAGVDRLNISLDTLRPDRFRDITRVGSLADVLRGLEAAESAGFQNLKLNCVLLGGVSDDEISDFAALTLTHPWQVRFIELMPMGTCVGWDRAHFLPSDAVLARCPQLREVGTQGVCRVYRLPGARGTVGLISPMSHRFCSGCDRIRVTADGRLKPCLHSSEEIPLDLHRPPQDDPVAVLSMVGGLDLAAMTGAFLGCAREGVAAVVDGFISAVAALCAARLCPAAKDMMFLSHASYEVGYRLAADELGLEPCLLLGMRLGEGSGCPLMFRVLQGACAVLRDMATFAEGEIQDDYLAPIRAMDAFTVENT